MQPAASMNYYGVIESERERFFVTLENEADQVGVSGGLWTWVAAATAVLGGNQR